MSLDHMKIRVYDNTCPPRVGTNEGIREGHLTIKPVLQLDDSSFGAEISGVDWSKPVPAEVVSHVGGILSMWPKDTD